MSALVASTSAHSGDDDPVFKHERLATPTSIRVLELLPGQKDTRLQIKVKQMELEDSWDKYEAVSYVWGSLEGTCPIYCDGRVILVTPNCRDLLFHLRRKHKTRLLWVDSICIDQTTDGDEERKTQIQLMGQIYHQARRVLVWLGHGDQNMRAVFWYLQYFGRISLLENKILDLRFGGIEDALSEVVRFAGLLSCLVCLGVTSKATQKTHQSAFIQLLQSPWFLRAWTVQEIAASRDCVVLYEGLSVPWNVLTSRGFPELIFKLQKDDYIMIEGRAAAGMLFTHHVDRPTATSQPFDMKAIRLQIELGKNELLLLRLIRHLTATRPEDKIFSMHSLFTLLDIPLPTPDYKKPVQQVLEDFVLGYIDSRKNLALLAITLPPEENSTLPSWVPDWLTPPRVDTREDYITNNLVRMFHIWKPFEASGGQQPILRLPRMMGRLPVAAKRVAGITSSWALATARPGVDSAEPGTDNEAKGRMEEILPYCRSWVRKVNELIWEEAYHSRNGVLYCALETTAFPRDYNSGNKAWDLWFDVMLYPHCQTVTRAEVERAAGEPQQGDLNSDDDILLRLLSIGRNSPSNSLALRFWIQHYSLAAEPSRYLVILDNLLFGSVFRDLKPDDEIFLLAGAHVPFVLRRSGTDADTGQFMYRLVSPAFVKGAMMGELWPRDPNHLTNIILM